MLFPATRFPGPTPELPPEVTSIWFGPDESTELWLLRPDPTDTPFPVILFTHGNAEVIDLWREPFEYFRQRGFGVALIEYPGYGRSGGQPSQRSITAAMLAAYDTLASRPEVDSTRMVAYGRSLGGGAACTLAERRPLAAVVLQSTFTSVRVFARQMGLPGMLVRDPFDNVKALESYEGPLLVLHGRRDSIIPVEEGKRLATSSGGQIVLLDCGHNDCPHPFDTILEFLREHGIKASV